MDDDKQLEDLELVADEENDLSALQNKFKKIKDKLAVCEDERKNYLDGWQRSKADFINYKKDDAKRLEDMARFIISGLISDILPVLDSFDLALKSVEAKAEAERHGEEQGILLVRSQLMDILKKRGFEQITLKVGEIFNPEKHESIGEVESDLPAGVIAEEVQKGYIFRERVLRPARVRLAKQK